MPSPPLHRPHSSPPPPPSAPLRVPLTRLHHPTRHPSTPAFPSLPHFDFAALSASLDLEGDEMAAYETMAADRRKRHRQRLSEARRIDVRPTMKSLEQQGVSQKQIRSRRRRELRPPSVYDEIPPAPYVAHVTIHPSHLTRSAPPPKPRPTSPRWSPRPTSTSPVREHSSTTSQPRAIKSAAPSDRLARADVEVDPILDLPNTHTLRQNEGSRPAGRWAGGCRGRKQDVDIDGDGSADRQ
ncbi:hypothetical protein R3P38DRAFT_3271305 [Favolaschia claudopus]|uniref:Uncharacterized protein n=1 Tax=Favolaschia claudopus TaxID=2862362 RepID=A0AAW0BAD6_9AGAR